MFAAAQQAGQKRVSMYKHAFQVIYRKADLRFSCWQLLNRLTERVPFIGIHFLRVQVVKGGTGRVWQLHD